MKAFKVTLKLNEEASPHLYVRTINELIKEDNYLHPTLKNLLVTLKKSRMPFVRLSLEKELVIDPNSHYHFERATKPEIHAWSKIEWTEEEISDFEKNKKKYIQKVLELQKKIGYDFYDNKNVTNEELSELIELTKLKKKKKRFWQKK